MSQKSNYNEDLIERAREIFLSNPSLTITELSKQSEALLGQHIPVDVLKDASYAGKWVVKRSAMAEQDSPDIDVAQQVKIVQTILFDQIVAESRSGLMITGDNLPELKQEIIRKLSGLDVEVSEVSARGANAQLINAFMNCLDKSGVDLKRMGTSAKTSIQQVIEAAREEVTMANN